MHSLFSAFEPQVVIPFVNAFLSLEEILAECQNAYHRRRTLLGFLQTLPRAQQTVLELNQLSSYISFLEWAKTQVEDSVSAYHLLLNYLLSRKNKQEKEITKIFGWYLAVDPVSALAFYERNACLQAAPGVKQRCLQHQVQQRLIELTALFAEQEDAFSLCPLMDSFFADPVNLSAAVLWVLEKGGTAEAIIQSQLLHHFVAYHAPELDKEDNIVAIFYEILTYFPSAQPLIQLASQTASNLRGLGHFSLIGKRSQSPLEHISFAPSNYTYTLTPFNFQNLYQLFGEKFLTAVFMIAHHTHRDFLTYAFDHFIPREALPHFIQGLVREYPAAMLEYLAPLLTEKVLTDLLTTAPGIALYFLPYCPELGNKVNIQEIHDFLKNVNKQTSSYLDFISQLIAIYEAFKEKNTEISTLVYKEIVAVVAQHADLLEDDFIVNLVKTFREGEAIVKKKIDSLESRYQQVITENMAAPEFLIAHYHAIEDEWVAINRQLGVLTQLFNGTTSCPTDKYAMQVALAQAMIQVKGDDFDLDQFLQALGVNLEVDSSREAAYERLLVALFIHIDSFNIQDKVVNKLALLPTGTGLLHQITHDYSCLERVIEIGNQTLFAQMVPHFSKKLPDIVKFAATKNRWSMVDFLCQDNRHGFHRDVLRVVFLQAAAAGSLWTVQSLLPLLNPRGMNEIVAQGFVTAAKEGRVAIVEYLLGLGHTEPSETRILTGLKEAIQHNQIKTIALLGNLPCPLVQDFLSKVCKVNKKFPNMSPTALEAICKLQVNRPHSSDLIVLFKASIHNNRMQFAEILLQFIHLEESTWLDAIQVAITKKNQYFLSLLLAKASSPAQIDAAFALVVKERAYNLGFLFINELPQLRPSIAAIGHALLALVQDQQVSAIHYLFRHIPMDDLKENVWQALIMCINHRKKSEVFNCLINLVNPTMRLEALRLAAQKGRLDLFRLYYDPEQGKRSKQELALLCQEASVQANEGLRTFLSNLHLGKTRPSRLIIPSSRSTENTLFFSGSTSRTPQQSYPSSPKQRAMAVNRELFSPSPGSSGEDLANSDHLQSLA